MKNILLSILFALIAIVSQAQTASQTTTSQTALKTFEDGFISVDWTAKTTIEQDAFNRQWTGLKIAVAKEIAAAKITAQQQHIADSLAQVAAQLTARTEFIQKLQSIGFLCDNGLVDWKRLYNYPEIYGSTYNQKAALAQSQSAGVDYFLNVASSMIYSPYEIGKAYKIGNTFIYQGELYSVVQSHISQADWIPSITLSLYKKATIAGTIAAWKQPIGSTDAYNIGDKVTFNGGTYESVIDANVWSPVVYAAGWRKL